MTGTKKRGIVTPVRTTESSFDSGLDLAIAEDITHCFPHCI
jgi:hypothetical protein